MDWKLYARSDRYYVKRYEEETNLRCQIVIDTSGSMYYPADVSPETGMNKIKFATHAAATLIELFKRQRDAVGLSLFDSTLQAHHKARSTQAHQHLMYAELERVLAGVGDGGGETAAVAALHTIAEATPKRSLIVLFSDMLDQSQDLDAVFAALAHLRHAKHEVVVFHVLGRTDRTALRLCRPPHHLHRFGEWGRGPRQPCRSARCLRRQDGPACGATSMSAVVLPALIG